MRHNEIDTVPGLVSVVMPVRNESRSIAGAIASVLRQTYPSIEVLVVDGRSEDDTVAIVQRIAAGDPRVRVLDNPRRTIPNAMNAGLREARGEFVARVDAHATVNDEYVALGVGHLRDDPGLVAVGGRRVGVARTGTGRAIALALSSPFGVGDSVNHFGTEVVETDHASFGVYRTAAARGVGGWDSELEVNEDVDFDYRLMAAGGRILYDPDMVIRWHVRETVGDLGRQYRRYGRGKGAMVRKNGRRAVRLRHLAPPALDLALATSAVLALEGRWRWAAALSAPYGAALVAASGLTAVRAHRAGLGGTFDAAVLPAAFAAMHTSWGLGSAEGLLAGRRPAHASQRDPVRPHRQQPQPRRDGIESHRRESAERVSASA